MLPHATCHTAAVAQATPSQPQAASFVCLFVCLLVCLACSFIWRALITRHAYAALPLPLPLASFIKKPKERRQSCPAPTPTPTAAPSAANPCQQQQRQQRSQAYAHNFRLAKFCLHISKVGKEAEGGEGCGKSRGRGTV